MLKLAADCTAGLRNRKCFLDLAQNLRLPDDHRIETCRNTEKVEHRFLIAVPVDVWRKQRGVQCEVVMQKTCEIHTFSLDAGKYFNAVTGGDDHALDDTGHCRQSAGSFRQLLARDRDTLSQFDRRSLMVDSNKRE